MSPSTSGSHRKELLEIEEQGGSLPSFFPVEPLLVLLLLLLTLLLLLLLLLLADVDDSGSACTGADDVTAPEGGAGAGSPEGCGDWTETDMVAAQADQEDDDEVSDDDELTDDIVVSKGVCW